MRTTSNTTRLASIALTALVALAAVPLLATSVSAAPTLSSVDRSTSWAYGGQATWGNGSLTVGDATFSYNATAGLDVVYNATNTTANITELTATRTIVVSVSITGNAPGASLSYSFKAVEDDVAYVNVTNAATVTLEPNGTSAAALGILNASLHANASIQSALVAQKGARSESDYLNASGWGRSQIVFTPALGLVPLNLSRGLAWTSMASGNYSAAWNVSYAYADHGWNGTNRSHAGDFNGTLSKTAEFYLSGSVVGQYANWVDHRNRLAVSLELTGPFNLHAGLFLVPQGFDIFRGAASAASGSDLGAAATSSEYVFFDPGRLSIESMSAANMSAGASTPVSLYSSQSGLQPATAAAAPPEDGATVWAQPESPSAAQHQAICLQYGCGGSGSSLSGLIVPLAIAGVIAVVAVGFVLSRRSRGRSGGATDTPLSAATSPTPTPDTTLMGTPTPPTPPTGSAPAGGQPPQ